MFINYNLNPNSNKPLCMSSSVSTRVPGIKKTKSFGATSRFYTVLSLFWTLKISDGFTFRYIMYLFH